MKTKTIKCNFKNSRGHTLAARLDIPAALDTNNVRATTFIIFCHCFTCTKETITTFRLSRLLAEHGYAVLRFDFTGLGDSEGDFLGWSVSSAGDVNGDGNADLIVGAYGNANSGYQSGSALVFSGLDGSILYTLNGDSASDQLGRSVSGVGDVNGDGNADLIVAAPGDDNNGDKSGAVRVFLTSDLMNDSDLDYHINTADNCPLVPNPDQADTDHDGVGDSCDNCISIANPGQEVSAVNADCGQACETAGCEGVNCANH